MAYIIKNTSGLVNTRVTDVGRQKLSQGKFNIAYFQVGDSEISYDKLPSTYNQSNSFILEPGFNSQNTSGVPQSNKQYVKYPYYADSNQRNTYGIPFMDSTIDPVFNRAPLRGFFGGITTATTINWEVLVGDNYALSSNYMVDMSMLNGSNQIDLIYSGCNITSEATPQIGDIITIYYDGNALQNCECVNLPTPTPTPTVSPNCSGYSLNSCSKFGVGATFTYVDCLTSVETTVFIANCDPDISVCSSVVPSVVGFGGFVFEGECSSASCVYNEWEINLGSPCTFNLFDCDQNVYDTVTFSGGGTYYVCSVYEPQNETACAISTITVVGPCTPTGTTTTTTTTTIPCASPTPTPTPSKTPCFTPTPSPQCPLPPPPQCFMGMNSCYTILTYRIIDVCKIGDYYSVTLDRPTPDYTNLPVMCYSRVLIYPQNMTQIYDSITPGPHWSEQVINFESICDTDQFDVKVWNMNIPWTENPAGLIPSLFEDYTKFGSIDYIGSKEYFGYNSSLGQTDTDYVYYYNSFDEIVQVKPEEQKAIAIIHYTNQTIDFFYGEKFALEPYDVTNPEDTTGQARNFKLHIPWLMWHKNPECCFGQTFWVDPPGFEDKELFTVHYIKSTKNEDMNQPGIRYYHLWDTNPNSDGIPSRIGKVFPDSKLVIIDDEEIIAAMSYKSNRNWTLPAPQISLITPNTCDSTTSATGILTGNSETMFVTYRLTSDNEFTNSLHCNYYSKVIGNNNDCNPDTSKNVAIRFGGEFGCLIQPVHNHITTTTTTTTGNTCNLCEVPLGFYGNRFEILAQKVVTGTRPDSTKWRVIDFTPVISGSSINGYLTQNGITGSTFIISNENYDVAPYYNLNTFIPLTPNGNVGAKLNFGDEYYFYGALETDIQATIYEMKYKVNLSSSEFQVSTNPSWTQGTTSYVTEIALLDENKDILVMSKLQSPTIRQGIQQYVVKIDF